MNRLSLKQYVASLLLVVMTLQMLSFVVAAQRRNSDSKSPEISITKQEVQEDFSPKSKLAPDLEEKAGDVYQGMRSDETQRVIIQLKSETRLNEILGNLNAADRDAAFVSEIRANKDKKGIIISDLARSGGRLKKAYYNLGLVSAELPLSKIRELSESENIAYISPDRDIEPTGHVETTTGASQQFTPTFLQYNTGWMIIH